MTTSLFFFILLHTSVNTHTLKRCVVAFVARHAVTDNLLAPSVMPAFCAVLREGASVCSQKSPPPLASSPAFGTYSF